MSQHRRTHGRTRTGRAGRARLAAGSGVLLALGTAFTVTLTSQGGPDDGDGTRAAKRTDARAAGNRDGNGNEARTEAARAQEEKADHAEERELAKVAAEERRKGRERAASTARQEEKREAAERKRKAAAAQAHKKAAAAKKREASEPASAGASASMSADERELITLLNERRSAAGLPRVEESGELASQAEQCSSASLAKGALEHCGHEVLFMGGSGTRPEAMLEAWFNSPGHKTALTYGSSTKAGAGIVTDDSGRLVAAITIDY
ncbi:CAP domain-containing protein [Streptomyces tubbatahanensis]|uniref:CAP domain-containing protein n=1 Tax=Streptomyces tubbatahanensis TaxID=2923272 RepID=A0ABY3Y1M3_9ACTN|nr:CAP domain-containing protein [Streptomyces tubbatahanensis]UNT00509.1 CAP domain-containing protein [Streptomyces tubbatahanensis]